MPSRIKEPRGRYLRSNIGNGYIHILIAEKALGRKLQKGEVVHHVDYNKHNNSPENLVICPSHAYHKLLHIRTEALKATGNAEARKCNMCKEWDSPENLYLGPKQVYHVACKVAYNRKHK